MTLKIGITERGDGGLDQSWRRALAEGRVDGAIVITKAPQLISYLPDHTVLHCTITGLGGTKIEPNVAPPILTFAAYACLLKEYGPERIVLRVDPILYWNPYLKEAYKIAEHCKGRMRISFIDFYPHVKSRFEAKGFVFINDYPFHGPLPIRKSIWEKLGHPEVCGEPGMLCTGCVSAADIAAMGLDTSKVSGGLCKQRKDCKCLAEKVELLANRGQCPHGCLYCYWK